MATSKQKLGTAQLCFILRNIFTLNELTINTNCVFSSLNFELHEVTGLRYPTETFSSYPEAYILRISAYGGGGGKYLYLRPENGEEYLYLMIFTLISIKS